MERQVRRHHDEQPEGELGRAEAAERRDQRLRGDVRDGAAGRNVQQTGQTEGVDDVAGGGQPGGGGDVLLLGARLDLRAGRAGHGQRDDRTSGRLARPPQGPAGDAHHLGRQPPVGERTVRQGAPPRLLRRVPQKRCLHPTHFRFYLVVTSPAFVFTSLSFLPSFT